MVEASRKEKLTWIRTIIGIGFYGLSSLENMLDLFLTNAPQRHTFDRMTLVDEEVLLIHAGITLLSDLLSV